MPEEATAVATETPTETPALTPAAPKPAQSPMESLLAGIRVTPSNETEAAPEEKKAEEPKETKAEAKEPETKKEPVAEPEKKGPSEATRENFKKLEDSRKAIEKERNEARTQALELQTRIQQLEIVAQQAEAKGKGADQLQQQLENAYRELNDTRQTLKAASIERDPEFIEQFVKRRERVMSDVKQLALASGATEDAFERALKFGDEDQLQEWRGALNPAQQRQWDARMLQVEQIDMQRQEAVENSDKTWQQLQQRQAKAYEEHASNITRQNLQLAANVENSFWTQFPNLNEHEELKDSVRVALKGLAGGEGADQWTPEHIMRQVGFATILSHAVQSQKRVIDTAQEEIAKRDTEIAELKKKVSEQEEFIGGQARDIPGGGSAVNSGNGERKSLLGQVRIHAAR